MPEELARRAFMKSESSRNLVVSSELNMNIIKIENSHCAANHRPQDLSGTNQALVIILEVPICLPFALLWDCFGDVLRWTMKRLIERAKNLCQTVLQTWQDDYENSSNVLIWFHKGDYRWNSKVHFPTEKSVSQATKTIIITQNNAFIF